MRNILIAVCLLIPGGAWGGYDDADWTVYRVEMDLADRLQGKLLDRIFGPDRSAVFVSMDVEFRRQEESESRKGMGEVQKLASKNIEISTGSRFSSDWPQDFFDPKSTMTAAGAKEISPDRSGAAQAQKASQTKEVQDLRTTVEHAAKRLVVRVLYDQRLSADDVGTAKGALKAALASHGKAAEIRFIPVRFRQ